MNIETLKRAWKDYQDAWSDISPAEREALLRKSVTEDVTFTNPVDEGRSLPQLMLHIEDFQKQYAGASFKSHTVIAHHGQMLAVWTMYGKDGAELLTGYSVAGYDSDDRITRLAGFWQQ